MTSFAISTPSPPARVHTPGTPKHGYNDSWEPYSPRKSARISAQRSAQRTPSPRAPSRSHNRVSTRSSADAFSTPAFSPVKKRMPAMDSVRRASGNLTAGGVANAADSLGTGSSHNSHEKPMATNTTRSAAMLPTPSKTPQKRPDEKAQAKIGAVARSLFPEADSVPSPKKRKTKKYSGLTLESFTAEEVDEPIEIFTDTRDRIPVADKKAPNPFYGNESSTTPKREQPARRSRSKPVTIPGEGKQTVDEALHREDGILYVFRGKKIFRKFSDQDLDSADEADGEIIDGEFHFHATQSSDRMRPLTRTSIKPRLLFPPKGKDVAKGNKEDEEAVTDIEDHVLGDAEGDGIVAPTTPADMVDEKPQTPVAPRFAPASPPSTVRATRASSRLQASETPVKQQHKQRSPFDGWRRSKSRAATHGQKRGGSPLAGPHDTSKRQRA
ncbi:hypothetical protein F5Y05DRAFT_373887 [Hypoxylon sp. FL0543]|nr:hypothetical protein F5Y05DRAFT_373887 [Hypoxylon sp. FL0543]